jgi:SAM-dependent methyltransferase
MLTLQLLKRMGIRLLEIPSKGLPKLQHGDDDFDAVHGTETSRMVLFTNPRSEHFAVGTRYQATPEAAIRSAIERSRIAPQSFTFLDIGCGKGRPLIVANQYHFRKLIGVEYSAHLCGIARRNLALCGVEAEVINGDAASADYPTDNTFAFFFNPFTGSIINTVLERLRAMTTGCELIVAWFGPGIETVAQHQWLEALPDWPPATGVFRKLR